MIETAQTIFMGAAPIQKSVFLLLAAAILLSCVVVLSRPVLRSGRLDGLTRLFIAACPMVGVMCAALNGLHMMQTVMRLPFPVTLRMLAPGLAEMAAFVVVGSIAGLAALLARFIVIQHPIRGISA